MIYYSHPGKELKQHLENVKKIGIDVFEKKSKLNFSYSKKDLSLSLSSMLFYHDIGKSSDYFQEYISSAINETPYKGKTDLKSHALISAVYASFKIHKRLTGRAKEILPVIVFACICKHHGNLGSLEDMTTITPKETRLLEKQWEKLHLEAVNEEKEFDFEEAEEFFYDLDEKVPSIQNSMENYLLLNFFFSILTYADKNDAIFDRAVQGGSFDGSLTGIVDNYKKQKFSSSANDKTTAINRTRNEIYELCGKSINIIRDNAHKRNPPDDRAGEISPKHESPPSCNRIFSINVPTGSGKTLTVIDTALKMIASDATLKRIIYALPFTSIIDQTAQIMKELFDLNNLDSREYLLVHHHLSEAEIAMSEDTFAGDKAQFIIENWEKPFILTTFWQFFNTLISNKNQLLRKFHNIADSVIILDEIQTLPYEYWKLVNETLKKLTWIFNCKIILLTATMPMIFSSSAGEITHLVDTEKREKYFKSFSRYQLQTIAGLNDITLEELFAIAREQIESQPDKSFLFVFNTIKSSRIFFEKVTANFSAREKIYLSTNILPADRKKRIEKIKKDKNRKIVVSTQLIEAGVDIDLDILYRDFAPLDSIVQAAGRCNRNNKQETGQVYLFSLKKQGAKRKDSNYIYEHHSLLPTVKLFEEIPAFKESDLLLAIDRYYRNVKEMISDKKSAELIKNIEFLEYDEIYSNFNLIEYMPTELIFIENDSAASQVLKKFTALLEIEDRWERRNEFLKIKRDFYNYTLSVKSTGREERTGIANLEGFGCFSIINKDIAANFYDEQTGYYLPDQIIF
ncbi:MAG: CRISPR-associated helicase Cas3' [Candidatus Aminicenantes bacterium]|nr:CRISPR-associated helicase Cas3' [Candidatus Aminicenantes bacterium]